MIPLLVAYIGPDVFLPLTSALAAIAGVLLLFWNRAIALLGSIWRFVTRQPKPTAPAQLTAEPDESSRS